MGRLATLACIAVTALACYFVIGTGAMFLGVALASLLGDPLGWSIYVLGIAVAIALAIFAPRVVAVFNAPKWFARTVIASTALFVCQQFAIAGTPDWSPAPLFVAFVIGVVCAVIAWARTGKSMTRESAASA